MKITKEYIKDIIRRIPLDKALHFAAGFGLAAVLAYYGASAKIIAGAVIAAGVHKEVFDYFRHGQPDIRDVFATCLGGVPVLFFVATQ